MKRLFPTYTSNISKYDRLTQCTPGSSFPKLLQMTTRQHVELQQSPRLSTTTQLESRRTLQRHSWSPTIIHGLS